MNSIEKLNLLLSDVKEFEKRYLATTDDHTLGDTPAPSVPFSPCTTVMRPTFKVKTTNV